MVRTATLTLAVSSGGRGGERIPLLALLKIDAHDGFPRESRGAGGKTQIILSRVADILTDSRLQKCALVYPQGERGTLGDDLAILAPLSDHRNAVSWPTAYFVERYLRCAVSLNLAELLIAFTYRSGESIDRHPNRPDHNPVLPDHTLAVVEATPAGIDPRRVAQLHDSGNPSCGRRNPAGQTTLNMMCQLSSWSPERHSP